MTPRLRMFRQVIGDDLESEDRMEKCPDYLEGEEKSPRLMSLGRGLLEGRGKGAAIRNSLKARTNLEKRLDGNLKL